MGFLSACLITIAVETVFLALLGYRKWDFILVCVCVNAATNLSLNLVVTLLSMAEANVSVLVYPLEALVVVVEYLVYARLEKPSWRLFGFTFAANALSYLLGLALYGHI